MMQIAPGQVMRVSRCRLQVGKQTWAYADTNRAEIAAKWQHSTAQNPGFFNGAIQILTQHSISGGVFAGDFSTTDFASFVHWRNNGFAGNAVRDCFGCAILRSAEGHVLLGQQAAGNLNAGKAYCPGGFIDVADVRADGSIDIDGSIAREIGEETGLDMSSMVRTPGYILAAAAASIAIGVEFRSTLAAEEMRADIMRHLERDKDPELSGIIIVRSQHDLTDLTTSAYVAPLIASIL
jgi:hypothetical protein